MKQIDQSNSQTQAIKKSVANEARKLMVLLMFPTLL